MKKIATTLILLCCFFINTVASASMILEYDGGVRNYTGAIYSLYVNDKQLTDLPMEPIIFNDRALVPVREVFEALGAKVTYDGNSKEVTIVYKGRIVKIWIDTVSALVDGIRRAIPDNVAPKLIAKWGESAKTMVPVRFVSESVGIDVRFDAEKGAIFVSGEVETVKPTPPPSPKPTPNAPENNDNKVNINKITATKTKDVVKITIFTDDEISRISKISKTTAGVVFADIYGASYTTKNKIEFDYDEVSSIRLGLHEEYTRVAIDTVDIEKYSVMLAKDKRSVVFQISADDDAKLETSEPTTTTRPTTNPSANPSASPTPTPSPTPKPIVYSAKKYVVIDAGHGGRDPGALGSLMTEEELLAYDEAAKSDGELIAAMQAGTGKTYYEKDIALAVAKMVRENLEANNINVIMTRSGDTYPELLERTDLANEKGAVMFVSIHLNATINPVTTANGIEVYYSTQNNDDDIKLTSKMLAEYLSNNLIDHTNATKRGVKTGNLLVNRTCQMPSALIEMGFMNNPYELELMADEKYQQKVAAGITSGILAAMKKVVLPK